MTNFREMIAASACGVLFAFGAYAADAPSAQTVLATVDGTEITLGHVISFRNRLPEQYKNLADDVLLQGILQQIIQQTVLMKAQKKEMNAATLIGFENVKRSFLASEMLANISASATTEENVAAAHQARYDGAVPEQEYKASHILVKTREEADTLIKLLDDGADFATLAREQSTGPSGPNGGDLGWFGAGDMVKPFEEAVMNLAIGEHSAPVQTQFGWHVIKLFDMRNQAIPALSDVREKLAGELQQSAIQDKIAQLMDVANVVEQAVDFDPAVIRDMSLLDK